MGDTMLKHTEDLRDAFGGDLPAPIEGHDVDADVRQRNREFVSSSKHGRSWELVSSIPCGLKEDEI